MLSMPSPHTTRALGALLLWGGLIAAAWGQDVRLLDCAQVHFFGPACVPVAPPEPVPIPPSPPERLFSPETMAPDTPPLLLKLLEEPSVDNARAFLAWQQQRSERMTEVQQLLRQLTRPSPSPTR
jgi:hypothetical protein